LKVKRWYKALILLVVIGPLLATIFAILLLWQHAVHASDIFLLLGMYAFTAMGVTIGYHRMLTHRSFRPHPAIKFLLLVLGSMSLEGAALEWAATHTRHHAQADREGDPHSPVEGFFMLILAGSSTMMNLIPMSTVATCSMILS
jgi:stearoyl-CoA desaturase (delta-9 desaturase)